MKAKRKLKVFDMRLEVEGDTFDSSEMEEFADEAEMIGYQWQQFAHGKTPHLLVLVEYRENEGEGGQKGKKKREEPRDPTEGLSEGDKALFETLRVWRLDTAKKAGLPAYSIASNKSLVEIVKERPQSLTALGLVGGFGEAALEKYGAAILGYLQNIAQAEKSGEG